MSAVSKLCVIVTMLASVKLDTSMSATTIRAAKPSGVTALVVSVPVCVSAEVANSTTPAFDAEAVSAVTVTSPVAPLTSIPAPATIELTFATELAIGN